MIVGHSLGNLQIQKPAKSESLISTINYNNNAVEDVAVQD
jgi:hypothetical protein